MDDKTRIYELTRELNALRRACCAMPIPTRGTFRNALVKEDPLAADALTTALRGIQNLVRPLEPGDPALVKRLREWVTENGVVCNAIINGHIGVKAIEYEDDYVRIACSNSSMAMEVERKENNNPVLCVWEDGKIGRTHGEFRHIEWHIAALLGV
jgi:hypothetical protein